MLGDCLGRVTEFKRDLDQIFKAHPNGVRGPESFTEHNWVRVPGMFKQRSIMPYTDDSRMALLVLKSMSGPVEYTLPVSVYNGVTTYYQPTLEDRMTHLAQQFVADQKDSLFGWAAPYRAPGNACRAGVKKLSERFDTVFSDPTWYGKIGVINQFTNNRLWDVEALQAGGCGSVMRAYPCGMIFADQPEKAIEYAVAQSRLTHSHPIALAASAGIAAGVAAAIRGETVAVIVNAIIDAAAPYDEKTAEKVRKAVAFASDNKPLLDSYGSALNALLQSKRFRDEHEIIFIRFPGWAADDALAGAVYCFCMSPESVIDAIHLGVHTSGDSDSIASLAGALVGAHCGIDQIRAHIPRIEDGEVAMRLAHTIATEAHTAK
jgi:ADP-ribosylglycohydrolase